MNVELVISFKFYTASIRILFSIQSCAFMVKTGVSNIASGSFILNK